MSDPAAFARGAITSLPTPFRDGVIDLVGLDRLVQHQARHPVSAIVVGGATGEGWSLDADEVGQLVARASETAAEHSRYRIHVVAGICEADSQRAARLARHAALAGADALLVGAPPFVRPSKTGLVRHVRTIADGLAAPLPIVLVNEPPRTGSDLTPAVVERICESVESVVAHCEGIGRPSRARGLAEDLPVPLLAGDDRLLGPYLRGGAVGAITTIGNLVPGEVVRLVEAIRSEDSESDAVERGLAPLVDALRVASNPVPIKAALAALDAIEPEVRAPLAELSDRERRGLARALTLARLLVPSS
ncbi:MAG: dihydrodipicolinate synthase family protein [Planctomycetota bacterium]